MAAAAGPLVGGYLLAVGSWRWVFFINVPVAAVVLVITARHVPETRDPTSAGRVDSAGLALAVVFLAGLTYGLIEGPDAWLVESGRGGRLAAAAVTAPPSSSSSTAAPTRCSRSSCSAPASSAEPTA